MLLAIVGETPHFIVHLDQDGKVDKTLLEKTSKMTETLNLFHYKPARDTRKKME